MPEISSITSSEIGILWMTYQQKTMAMRLLEYFIEKADDENAKEIMVNLYNDISPYVDKIVRIFQAEGVAVPIGFTSEDINRDTPKLYDNGFDIMFVRLLNEISSGIHTLNLTMAYRKDITTMFRELTAITQKYYEYCTQYLLEKGLMPKSPYISTENQIEFVKDESYLRGLNPIGGKRPLNTVEISHIYHAIESNIVGMQLIFGFAQCASEKDISKYFFEGGELAKGIIKELSEIFLQNNIPVPGTAGGNVTTSELSPFSDKIMMYCVSLFCSFSLGGNSLGTAFCLRKDIPAKFSIFMKDIFEYAYKGGKLMIKHGWMEEPPQSKDQK